MDMPQSRRNENNIFADTKGSVSGKSTRGSIRFDPTRESGYLFNCSWILAGTLSSEKGFAPGLFILGTPASRRVKTVFFVRCPPGGRQRSQGAVFWLDRTIAGRDGEGQGGGRLP